MRKHSRLLLAGGLVPLLMIGCASTMRLNTATQSALDLLGSDKTPVINLKSEGFGKFTKGIKVKVDAGSLRGKKLTSQFGNDYYSADNVTRDVLSLSYTGEGATAHVTVTAGAMVLTVGGTEVQTIDLGGLRHCPGAGGSPERLFPTSRLTWSMPTALKRP